MLGTAGLPRTFVRVTCWREIWILGWGRRLHCRMEYWLTNWRAELLVILMKRRHWPQNICVMTVAIPRGDCNNNNTQRNIGTHISLRRSPGSTDTEFCVILAEFSNLFYCSDEKLCCSNLKWIHIFWKKCLLDTSIYLTIINIDNSSQISTTNLPINPEQFCQ